MPDRRANILSEAERLEQVTWFAAEGHITAAGFWSTFQIFWGSAAAVLAAVAAGTAFAEHSIIAGALGIAATAAAAVMASLQPSERLAAHLSYAGQYHALQSGLHSLRVLEADELRTQTSSRGSKRSPRPNAVSPGPARTSRDASRAGPPISSAIGSPTTRCTDSTCRRTCRPPAGSF